MPVTDAPNHNFIPQAESAAIDYARKVFVPWPLYDPRGEWHFRLNHKTPGKITDEHWNIPAGYEPREYYYMTTRNHLLVSGADAGDFVPGVLDTWTASALQFDGNMQGVVQASGVGEVSLDIGTNNCAIEAFFRTIPGHVNGAIVSKVGARGYIVDIDSQGHVRLRLWNNDADTFARSSSVVVNNGGWHHVFIDVDRSDPQGAHIYVDGARADLPATGVMPDATQDLTTGAGLVVGSALGVMHFNGALEFLRIARGNLADAKTTFDELYEWEFNGPQYYGFRGVRTGAWRDAGAFEAGDARPVIVTQPQDTIIEYGYSAGLRVAAGNATTYQWYKRDQAIAGATGAVLALSHVGWADQGDYLVVAGDGNGTAVTSACVNVAVVPEPCALLALVSALVLLRRGAATYP
jgi:hypothetical protein